MLLCLSSADGDLAAHADALALALAGDGSVYRGVAPVRPGERMAATAPTDLVVALDGVRGRSALDSWTAQYLRTNPGATLTIEREGRRTDVRADEAGAASAAIDRLTTG